MTFVFLNEINGLGNIQLPKIKVIQQNLKAKKSSNLLQFLWAIKNTHSTLKAPTT